MRVEKTKILFVCMGNICRSPTAEGVFSKKLKERGLEDLFEIDSAGTHAYHIGEPPDHRSSDYAAQKGVDLTTQKARQVSLNDFDYFDYIIAMDRQNLADLTTISAPKHHPKLSLMLSHAPNETTDVPDPYFNNCFDKVFQKISRSSDFLLTKILDSK